MKKENPSIRINRFIAMCGICSRRKADLLIENGRVKITGNEDDVWYATKSGLEELPVFFSYQKQV